MALRHAVDAGIQVSLGYSEWDAFIAAGATIEELNKLESGGYGRRFRAKVVAWNNSSNLIKAHQQDAEQQLIRKRGHGGRS